MKSKIKSKINKLLANKVPKVKEEVLSKTAYLN